jgi:hypothetical protein
MKRLFTFGCSFTKYHYPTWANFLSVDFDYFENWGKSGIGNKAITERIVECHVKNKFTKDDTVIVQWSSHLRYDYSLLDFLNNGWQINGGILNPVALQNVYNNNWHEIFFDEQAYIMHSLNHIVMIDKFLKNTNCTYFMTSIGNFDKLGTDLINEVEHLSKNKPDSINKNYPQLSHYFNSINFNNWIEPLITSIKENPELSWTWRMGPGDGTVNIDSHPSPKQHLCWVNKYLRPKLNLEPKQEVEWLDLLDAIPKLTKQRYKLTKAVINEGDTVKHIDAQFNYWPPKKSWNTDVYGF